MWANPDISGVYYDSTTVSGANPGDYIAFEWDDAYHDVWLVPANATDPCSAADLNFGATLVISSSHHATFDPTTNLHVPGRNLFKIPTSAAGSKLVFVCSVAQGAHCHAGQQVDVAVGTSTAAPNPDLVEGVCPEGFTLCPDQSQQTETTATVETKVNIPWIDPIAMDQLQLSGTVTRASTPWDQWAVRRVEGKVCRERIQNTRTRLVEELVALWPSFWSI